MSFVYYNPNPAKKTVGDCVIRAISKLLDQTWEVTYFGITMQGYDMFDMPSSNHVWGEYLRLNNCRRYIIPDTCPMCYTVRQFCYDHPYGKYLLATGSHVVTVENGDYFDTWDSGQEVPVYYWRKEN